MQIENFDEIQETFEKLDKEFHNDLLKEVTIRSYEKAKKKASEHNVTGQMERSVFHRFSARKQEGTLGATAPHAIFVHFGTKPHVIERKEKKSLRWVKGDVFMFAKKVFHPGYKGDPFIYNAIQDTFKEIDEITDDILKDY